jgi:DNA-binding NtrC family response regulator
MSAGETWALYRQALDASMDGIQTLKALKTIDSGTRALLSTGFGLNGRLPEATAAGFTGWVQKPFHLYELSVAVAQALKTQH